MAIAFVRANFNNSGAMASDTVILPGVSTTGNFLIAVFFWGGAVTITSVTDNKSNTYTLIGTLSYTGTRQAAYYYAQNITGGGAVIEATVTFSGTTTTYLSGGLIEYSGGATSGTLLDQHAEASGSSTAMASGAATTTFAKELIFGAGYATTGGTSSGASYTLRYNAIHLGGQWVVEQKLVTSTGSQNADASCGNNVWVMLMATFAEAGQEGVGRPDDEGDYFTVVLS